MEAAMKSLSRTMVVIALASLSTSLLSGQSAPQEKLVFQNDYVRVFEANLNPGVKLPAHESGERLIYSLTSYVLTYRWDGKTSEERRKAGDLHFHPSGKHAEENNGKQKASFLIIERTAAPLPASDQFGIDMAKASPFNTQVLFDRDLAKVFEVKFLPHDAVGMHRGLPRLIYALTPFDLLIKTPDGKVTKETGKKGSFQWHPAGMHSVENRTAAPTRLLVIGFKR
jgi:uncharacterized RmlC-like cupin family protein